jgi:hypothetical protein
MYEVIFACDPPLPGCLPLTLNVCTNNGLVTTVRPKR